MMENELTYWVALTHTPKIWTKRKNEIIVYCFNLGKTIADFFESENFLGMELKHEEQELLLQTKKELANYAFLVEELLNQGYSIIPITSQEYSPTLKANLKYNTPIILYTKGNKQLLKQNAIAIVGSRNANDKSLLFTDNVAKKAQSLISGHFVDNPASGRVMEKCRFQPTGETCIDETQYQGKDRPIRVLRLELK